MLGLLLAAAIVFANTSTMPLNETPQPQATIPIDFDQFCESHHAGHSRGSIAAPVVVLLCDRWDYKWSTKCDLRTQPYRDACWIKIDNLPGVDNERGSP